jgi:hypothetical protein
MSAEKITRSIHAAVCHFTEDLGERPAHENRRKIEKVEKARDPQRVC